MSDTKETSLGLSRVRVNFNLTGSTTVDKLKIKSAELIDLVEGLKKEYLEKHEGASVAPGELIRLVALAETAYEEAAMWAVKAATYA